MFLIIMTLEFQYKHSWRLICRKYFCRQANSAERLKIKKLRKPKKTNSNGCKFPRKQKFELLTKY